MTVAIAVAVSEPVLWAPVTTTGTGTGAGADASPPVFVFVGDGKLTRGGGTSGAAHCKGIPHATAAGHKVLQRGYKVGKA